MAVGRPTSAASPPSTPLLIAGIGASAGGLEAVTRLVEQLPADTGMAFVLTKPMPEICWPRCCDSRAPV